MYSILKEKVQKFYRYVLIFNKLILLYNLRERFSKIIFGSIISRMIDSEKYPHAEFNFWFIAVLF
ncbi:MAG: hypothetical protein EA359_02870 [Balneolaceae bacterium]|nr:MAG: hypothetical protein EA359_02870 [Balneolaceae bacterium]